MLNDEYLIPILRRVLLEDIGTGDLSASVIPDQPVHGYFLAKRAGVISGIQIPALIYRLFEHEVTYQPLVKDADTVAAGTKIATVDGSARDLLAAERVTLNLIQRMSGIASATAKAVSTLDNAAVGILDTRKTVPGLRQLDKYAVSCGGGVNHRMGLYDSIMLKDNHWQLFGKLATAVKVLRQTAGPTKSIEVEVENENQLQQAIDSQVDMILIDNQPPTTVADWCQRIPANIKTEASGGIELANLPAYGQTGVDFISLGYLTNSVQALDISFDLEV
ncbi:carboxylating nicotinate-nucleotide diphosphorylase [Lactobacillus sp. CRM56-3]|uniref:Probable nicotinate-nucleotide pyrophosphorylase [carboxylating] n=2 Tax=Secundilactobacillus folii TaxID=2678357 RepID=A0A7X2XUN8_9LACO|nr:carboxylating nicotinate-nucleotide diphosphorylase [Secundilactobacillus folii]